jgi:hypothetical protein
MRLEEDAAGCRAYETRERSHETYAAESFLIARSKPIASIDPACRLRYRFL